MDDTELFRRDCVYCRGSGKRPDGTICLKCDGDGHRGMTLLRRAYDLGYTDALKSWREMSEHIPNRPFHVAELRKRLLAQDREYEQAVEAKLGNCEDRPTPQSEA